MNMFAIKSAVTRDGRSHDSTSKILRNLSQEMLTFSQKVCSALAGMGSCCRKAGLGRGRLIPECFLPSSDIAVKELTLREKKKGSVSWISELTSKPVVPRWRDTAYFSSCSRWRYLRSRQWHTHSYRRLHQTEVIPIIIRLREATPSLVSLMAALTRPLAKVRLIVIPQATAIRPRVLVLWRKT